ncbi:hypothetical protein PR048_032307 [Dryococelus australis]|uniref:Uncharacterized protein n=1 Tax=Dryococelus australis TaxID=614101 RepID=A0ABQ9G1W3_9NEOP|nr:hypothetical protein PR048_032307 [Dryococelus australis]
MRECLFHDTTHVGTTISKPSDIAQNSLFRHCRMSTCADRIYVKLRYNPELNLALDFPSSPLKVPRKKKTVRRKACALVKCFSGDAALDARVSVALTVRSLPSHVASASRWGRGGMVVRPLASQQGELGSIPRGDFTYVGIVPDVATGRWVFSVVSLSPRPCIPGLLHKDPLHPHRLSRRLADDGRTDLWSFIKGTGRREWPLQRYVVTDKVTKAWAGKVGVAEWWNTFQLREVAQTGVSPCPYSSGVGWPTCSRRVTGSRPGASDDSENPRWRGTDPPLTPAWRSHVTPARQSRGPATWSADPETALAPIPDYAAAPNRAYFAEEFFARRHFLLRGSHCLRARSYSDTAASERDRTARKWRPALKCLAETLLHERDSGSDREANIRDTSCINRHSTTQNNSELELRHTYGGDGGTLAEGWYRRYKEERNMNKTKPPQQCHSLRQLMSLTCRRHCCQLMSLTCRRRCCQLMSLTCRRRCCQLMSLTCRRRCCQLMSLTCRRRCCQLMSLTCRRRCCQLMSQTCRRRCCQLMSLTCRRRCCQLMSLTCRRHCCHYRHCSHHINSL